MLRTRTPLAISVLLHHAAVQLACIKPAASVHPEPGSNSPLYIFSFYVLGKNSFCPYKFVFVFAETWLAAPLPCLFLSFFFANSSIRIYKGYLLLLSIISKNCFSHPLSRNRSRLGRIAKIQFFLLLFAKFIRQNRFFSLLSEYEREKIYISCDFGTV